MGIFLALSPVWFPLLIIGGMCLGFRIWCGTWIGCQRKDHFHVTGGTGPK